MLFMDEEESDAHGGFHSPTRAVKLVDKAFRPLFFFERRF